MLPVQDLESTRPIGDVENPDPAEEGERNHPDARGLSLLARFESALDRGLVGCTRDSGRAAIVLVLICLVQFLPGVFSRPPVDRTEVYYAQSARRMLESGSWLVPHDQNGVIEGRPIGIVWLQALSARLVGPSSLDAIWAYRLPSVIGATLAILFLFLGMRSIMGDRAAFCASILLSNTLLLAIQARLALPQSGALAASIVAQTGLARLYLAGRSRSPAWRKATAFAIWAALGIAVDLNSLIVPIVASLTVIGLYAQDRNLLWLKGTSPALGLLLAVVIAFPWGLSLWASITGTPGPHMPHPFMEWLSLFVDSQAMKHRAFPGSYLLTIWLAFLPCLLLFYPSCRLVWWNRSAPSMRFLMAWMIPYLAAMELVSQKPPLYMVQYVAPALAIAMSLRIVSNPITGAAAPIPLPRVLRALWAILGLLLAALPLVLQSLVGDPLSPPVIVTATAVVLGYATTAVTWRGTSPATAMTFSLAGGVAFYWLMTALILPTSSLAWPSVHLNVLRDMLRTCYPAPIAIAGYSEPSAVFLIGTDTIIAQGADIPKYLKEKPGSLGVVDLSEMDRLGRALRAGGEPPVEIACVSGSNLFTGRGNALLRVYAKDPPRRDPACLPPARFRCPAFSATAP